MKTELKTLKKKQELDKIGKELRKRQDKGEVITLKTLKDFEGFIKESLDPRIDPDIWEGLDMIKAEAVKWVKHFDKKREDSGMLRGEWEKNWIINFFNLTSEDLK